MSDNAIEPARNTYRARVLLIGGILGSVLGIVSAILYLRAADEVHGPDGAPQAPEAGDAVKLGVALLGIIRTITEWAKRA
jgi:hypothetical protein